MQRDNITYHENRKGQISLNHKPFINQFEHWLKHDLPNASNHMRVAFILHQKVEKIADHIQDFNSEHNKSEYIQWYPLDITESTFYTEKPVPRKKPILKCKCNINFKNKVLNFVNLSRLLRSEEIIDSGTDFVKQDVI